MITTILAWIGSLLVGLASAFGYTRTTIKTLNKDVAELKEADKNFRIEFEECKETCVKFPTFIQFEKRFEEAVGSVQDSIDKLHDSNDMILKELLFIKSKIKNGG